MFGPILTDEPQAVKRGGYLSTSAVCYNRPVSRISPRFREREGKAMRWIALLLLPAVLLLAAACEEEEEEAGPTVAPTVEAEATETPEPPEATATMLPPTDTPVPEGGGEPTDEDAALRAEAEAVCPEEFLEPCTEAYVMFATGDLPAILCVSSVAGTWYFATPGATPVPGSGATGNEGEQVGDPCAEEGHVVVALVGGGG